MQDQFVFNECTLIFVQFLRNNNVEINNPKLSDYLNIYGAVVDKVKYPSNPTVFRAVVLDSHS